ncbi:MAG: NfeD family protein [Oscillospiraceae bacterium]|nr:NfeD family protein [Oscillospiraceae bacterium]
MIVVWAVLIVVFFVVEGATAGLASIWFAAGAIFALAAAFLDAPIWLQVVIFIVVSVACLFFTRPLARKYVNRKIQPTNADKVIGSTVTVTERIDNIERTGEVSVGTRIWIARSESGSPIETGALVIVKAIEGAKLIVNPLPITEMAENIKV